MSVIKIHTLTYFCLCTGQDSSWHTAKLNSGNSGWEHQVYGLESHLFICKMGLVVLKRNFMMIGEDNSSKCPIHYLLLRCM